MDLTKTEPIPTVPKRPELSPAQQAYKLFREECIAQSAKLEAMREELAKDCNHPAEFVRDDEWESDNGYGRQEMHPGLYCWLCRRHNHWPKDGYKSDWKES